MQSTDNRDSDQAPLVGVTAANDPLVPGHYILRWDYVHAIEAAGGIPVILAPSNGVPAHKIMQRLDGLILSGGHDITPSIYGGKPHPTIRDNSLERDEFELDLVRYTLEHGVPFLGICRGLQMLNLALGGGLIQNIPDRTGNLIAHNDPERPRDMLAHSVRIMPGTLLHTLVERDTIPVNSFHHQAVSDIPEELTVCAIAEDQIIEGLELTDHPFALGIQWHPEALWRQDPAFFRYFQALVDAARHATNGPV